MSGPRPSARGYIGIDLGTSSTKAVLVGDDGTLHGSARVEYPMLSPHPGWNENDPNDWRTAFVQVVSQLAATATQQRVEVGGLALVAQRDPFVLLGDDDRPVAPAISWTDQRARSQTEQVKRRVGEQRLIDIAGARPIVGLGLGNLLWVRDEQPEVWSRVRRVVAPKDFVLGMLGQRRTTDITTPTRSMAFDIAAQRWSTEILNPEQVPLEWFDTADLSPWEIWGELDQHWARKFGLPAGLPIGVGGSDDQAATLGAGAAAPGDICLGTGTCSDWRLVLPSYQPDSSGVGDTSPHVVPDSFIREVTIDSAGSSLRWFRDVLCPGLSYAQIVALATTAPAGAGGVRFLPFVDGGQRAPYYLDHSAGVFFGINSHHRREHLARAVLEGIALLYPSTYELLLANVAPGSRPATDTPLTMVDGEASSVEWTRMKADILGRPLRTTAVTEAAAMGAAVLAANAAGHFDSPATAADQMVQVTSVCDPDPRAQHTYLAIREDFEMLFATVAPAFDLGGERP